MDLAHVSGGARREPTTDRAATSGGLCASEGAWDARVHYPCPAPAATAQQGARPAGAVLASGLVESAAVSRFIEAPSAMVSGSAGLHCCHVR